jgi:hypothetical protein
MTHSIREVHDHIVLVCPPDGAPVREDRSSTALRDWVTEANRGRQVWFVADLAELDQRLSAAARPRPGG